MQSTQCKEKTKMKFEFHLLLVVKDQVRRDSHDRDEEEVAQVVVGFFGSTPMRKVILQNGLLRVVLRFVVVASYRSKTRENKM